MTYLYAKIWKTLHRKNLLNGGGRAEDYGGVGQVWSIMRLIAFFNFLQFIEVKQIAIAHLTFQTVGDC